MSKWKKFSEEPLIFEKGKTVWLSDGKYVEFFTLWHKGIDFSKEWTHWQEIIKPDLPKPELHHSCRHGALLCHYLGSALMLTYQRPNEDSEHFLATHCPFCGYTQNKDQL